MKKIIILSAGFILMHSVAHADLPASAISTMNLSMYGMYTTSDPTCQTGLTATIQLFGEPYPWFGTGCESH
jgi:hypothetical protein